MLLLLLLLPLFFLCVIVIVMSVLGGRQFDVFRDLLMLTYKYQVYYHFFFVVHDLLQPLPGCKDPLHIMKLQLRLDLLCAHSVCALRTRSISLRVSSPPRVRLMVSSANSTSRSRIRCVHPAVVMIERDNLFRDVFSFTAVLASTTSFGIISHVSLIVGLFLSD